MATPSMSSGSHRYISNYNIVEVLQYKLIMRCCGNTEKGDTILPGKMGAKSQCRGASYGSQYIDSCKRGFLGEKG